MLSFPIDLKLGNSIDGHSPEATAGTNPAGWQIEVDSLRPVFSGWFETFCERPPPDLGLEIRFVWPQTGRSEAKFRGLAVCETPAFQRYDFAHREVSIVMGVSNPDLAAGEVQWCDVALVWALTIASYR